MANSFYSVYEHIVFSTKHRQPWLSPEITPELHAYLGGSLKNQGCTPLIVGGMPNHVHMLIRKKNGTIATSDVVKEVKRSSCEWLNERRIAYGKFHWQDGFGAFSISYWDKDKIVTYINNQEQHHRKMSWEDEFRKLLIKHGEEFDERYYLD